MSVNLLDLVADMPERRLESGEVLYDQGHERDLEVAVLVTGALDIVLEGEPLSEITVPGAFIGEIGALLHTARTATVVAREPSTVRVIGDPDAFFTSHPEIGLELSRQLAGRLHRLLAYLGDVRAQYSGTDGHLTMVDAVLGKLASRPTVDIETGSDREPDYP